MNTASAHEGQLITVRKQRHSSFLAMAFVDWPKARALNFILPLVFAGAVVGFLLFWFQRGPDGFSGFPKLPAPSANFQNFTGSSKAVSLPAKLNIPKIGVKALITSLGLNSDMSLTVPENPEEVGWYIHSPAPGAIGPAILVGHLDSKKGPAVFYNLHKLEPGDLIETENEDGNKLTFQVEDIERFPQNAFPTNRVYGPVDSPQIRLITCSGKFNFLKQRYSENLIVYASLIKPPDLF